jgi:hypothetical protein
MLPRSGAFSGHICLEQVSNSFGYPQLKRDSAKML